MRKFLHYYFLCVAIAVSSITTACSANEVAQHNAKEAANKPSNKATEAETLARAGSLFPINGKQPPGKEFRKWWRDGQAELSHYSIQTSRYGQARRGELVLIYVTEPMDSRRWIKDDAVSGSKRIEVLKLNSSLKFLTGIYPYSVMTSVFSPTGRWAQPRFTPAKITLSAQEWCGHVFSAVWPMQQAFRWTMFSYFPEEGEFSKHVQVPAKALYEDALWIQLRELDGLFNQGRNYRGSLVPSLWSQRKTHALLEASFATIERTPTLRNGVEVVRFELRYEGLQRRYFVEKEIPHRILAWEDNQGEHAELVASQRLAYWDLNGAEDGFYRKKLGLEP